MAFDDGQLGLVKAAVTTFVIDQEGRDDVCSVCGDDPALDYRLEKPLRPAGGPDTLRLYDDCLEMMRSIGSSSRPTLGFSDSATSFSARRAAAKRLPSFETC